MLEPPEEYRRQRKNKGGNKKTGPPKQSRFDKDR